MNHWRSLALQEIKRFVVPGNHDTLFEEPNTQKLAEILHNAIELIHSKFIVKV
ncbi:MAG: hypothetical protein JSR33_05405 [Proteobacteria bacterium]|nr:hypothetical protein [Pseudomonadota bacterium]